MTRPIIFFSLNARRSLRDRRPYLREQRLFFCVCRVIFFIISLIVRAMYTVITSMNLPSTLPFLPPVFEPAAMSQLPQNPVSGS